MKRTWTIIGVGDVAGSFKWYQALFGRPATVPLENPARTRLCRSVHGPTSSSRTWPGVTKLTFFAAP
jgi:hypothetical protein